MKTLRMFGMALVAIIMGVSLSSCNKDENPENDGDFSNEKKLVKEVWEEDGETITYTYIYDDKGRLAESKSDSEHSIMNQKFIWGDDVVKTPHTTYTIENGVVKSSNDGSNTFTNKFSYNESKRLIKIEENMFVTGSNHTSTTTAIWDGDRLVVVDDDITLTYAGESCKKGFYIPYYIILEEPLLSAHPELFGMRTKQLPKTISGRDWTETYSYEFNEEGYVSKVTILYKDSTNASYTNTVTYIWE